MTRNGMLRVVPWVSIEEWEYVADCVAEHDSTDTALDEALRWLEVWCIRGNIPPAVETTYNLLCIKKCMQITGHSMRCSQLALAAALIRFVNEIVDPHQQGTFAMPVVHLAERMNIPRLLVDLRHTATHDELPSLSVLVIGMEMALDWLRDSYWNPQSNFKTSIIEATEKMLIRFIEGAKECDPLTKPVDLFADKCINDVANLDASADVQKVFLSTIIYSSYPTKAILPMIGALLRFAEEALVIIVSFALQAETTSESLYEILEYCIPMIRKEATMVACVKACLLKDGNDGHLIIENLLSKTKMNISNDFRELIKTLLDSKSSSSPSSSVQMYEDGDLIEKTDCLLNKQRPLDDKPKGWHIKSDWKPLPFGQTASFDLTKEFYDLMVK